MNVQCRYIVDQMKNDNIYFYLYVRSLGFLLTDVSAFRTSSAYLRMQTLIYFLGT